MEIFYCDVCGLRLSAAESEAAQSGGEEAKPLCAKCRAQIQPPMVRKVSVVQLAPATVSSRKLLPAQRHASARREPELPSGHRRSTSRIGVYILVGVLAGSVGAVFVLTNRNAAPSPTVELTASPPRKAESEPPPDTQKQNAEPKPSPTERPQPSEPSATATTSIEKAAQEEFEQLRRFAGIGAEDWNGRAAHVETFLQRYGETAVGARARVLLREFQGRLTEAQPAVADALPPPSTTPPRPKTNEPPPPVAPPPIETKLSDGDEPDAFAIATGSAAFQDEILELMRKRDLTAAAARLKRAEADPLLKQLQQEVAAYHKALEWLADFDNALLTGVEKLREIDNFELRLNKGTPIRVGKAAPFHFQGLKDNVLQLTGQGLELPVALDSLRRETLQRLCVLGLGSDATGRVRAALAAVLDVQGGGPAALSTAGALIKGAKNAGAAADDLACLGRLCDWCNVAGRETEAATAWAALLKTAETDTAGMREAVVKYKLKHGATKFGAAKKQDLAGVLLTAEGKFNAGLTAYWRLDETAGRTAADSTAHGYDGTVNGNAAWAEGRIRGALQLSNGGEFVEVPHNAGLNAYPLTISVWAQTTGKAGGIVCKYLNGSRNGYSLHLINGLLLAWYCKSYNDVILGESKGHEGMDGGAISDGNWHHLAFCVDGAGGRLYVDGVEKDSRKWTGKAGAPDSTEPLLIGRKDQRKLRTEAPGNALEFKGKLDDVRIYNRALTEAEVQALALLGH